MTVLLLDFHFESSVCDSFAVSLPLAAATLLPVFDTGTYRDEVSGYRKRCLSRFPLQSGGPDIRRLRL